ncbi:FAD-binding oxidoreductase [Nosocomiicoccus massiliensis]|uniref:FAD-binding oxidoreductase n=1 Tax=Nosocomiicoccus massiliensis TaxID=1232430 RepID=UPI00059257C6|nr:FAD-linked oxidase C-terminal domain-containing protein [Nosocomiicoccus massiliensis]
MNDSIIKELKNIFKSRLLLEVDDRVSYSYDASFGQYMPDAVVQVLSTEEVVKVVNIAKEHNIPLYPRGASSSLSGGPLPVHKGIVLDFSQWDDTLEIYPEDLIVKVSPGVITDRIHELANQHNLMYAPDPSSSRICTIGGNLAENAGGPRGVKYGVTKDHVLGLEIVTANGDVVKTGGNTVKNVTGYDLTKLIIGSEGTLGIITEATLRLIPKPEDTLTAMVIFEDIVVAGESISKILSSGIHPSKMEILDKNSINRVEDFRQLGLPRDADAILLIEVDGNKKVLHDELNEVKKVLASLNVTNVKIAQTKDEEKELWEVRKLVSPAIVKSGYTKLSEDATVPLSKIPDMFNKVNELKEKYNLNLVIFGHAGDGNLHPNLIINMRDDDEVKRAEKAIDELFKFTISIGGTLSGEHGIGTMKRAYMKEELKEAGLNFQKLIKQALDPQNILNPGKIFPEKDEQRIVLKNE